MFDALQSLLSALSSIPSWIYFVLEWVIFTVVELYEALSGNDSYSTSRFSEVDVGEELWRIDGMDGLSFEEYAAQLLRENGYTQVEVTPGSGDYGADIIAFWNEFKYVVSCKRYSGNLGIRAVQEITLARIHYNAHVAVVLTNSYFTNAAKKAASESHVELWDREYLSYLLERAANGS